MKVISEKTLFRYKRWETLGRNRPVPYLLTHSLNQKSIKRTICNAPDCAVESELLYLPSSLSTIINTIVKFFIIELHEGRRNIALSVHTVLPMNEVDANGMDNQDRIESSNGNHACYRLGARGRSLHLQDASGGTVP